MTPLTAAGNEGKSFPMVETVRKVAAESLTAHVGDGACNTAVSLARRGWQPLPPRTITHGSHTPIF